ncbi:MAG: DUF6089 family protein [Cellulophaga sp.]|uniref:type IX secretion system protein PorG n=1 Tax=unclassified Cellulophaga TaxID=2634405 RepID=UPI000C2CBADD|nr:MULTISPECIES: DUF6089 family protein [unclassified Cellulophaga]MDO6490354.1 DUF6089 family protein [Cellulophaga sp. 2_MG-2023]MDO6494452.1 DUF6089 family protein [Cellulophaga sp. 3_MG-2023]PKB42039.1 hypothetical protein AX016_0196 [Cellulophaga sp. RHA19]
MRIFIAILLFSFFGVVSAQTYEVGVLAGGLNNIGDVGKTNYISPSGFAYGGIFKWNKSKRYAWRASILHGKFVADDLKSGLAYRQKRQLKMENTVTEFSAGLEVNFVEYNLHKLGPAFTPYLYTGVTYFRYDYNYFEVGFLQDLDQREGDFAIPMTVGLKYRLNQFFILGAEIGARYTFTDNLDASNPEKANVSTLIDPKFGNIFSDDWYVFSGFTLTYTFGRKPCSDCFE